MRTKTKRILAGVVAMCGVVGAALGAAPARKLNVVLFLVDDMGWRDSGVYGSRYYETPSIDRFATRAMRFTDAYAQPLCSPTRASILTGKYSARHGVTSATGHLPPQPTSFAALPASAPANRKTITPESKNYLDPAEFTLAEALREAGWRTGHVGKWHIGLTEPHWPAQHGFEHAVHAHPDPGPPSYFSPYGFRGHQSYKDGPPGEYITDRLTDEAIAFLEGSKERPFYLQLWHHGVHGPWGHKEEYTKAFLAKKDPSGRQGNPIMGSMLKSIDESFGRLLAALERLQLAENTIVIFYSDNGGNTHSNMPDDKRAVATAPLAQERLKDWRKWAADQPPTNNAPLRDGKGTLYEGGVRVPLMIAWPGVAKGGSVSEEVVGHVDLYPTILDALGLPLPKQQAIDGVSFASVLRGAAPLGRRAFFNYFPHGGGAKAPGVTVRSGDWKLIRWFETGPKFPEKHELYNLREDIGETKNLAAAMPERVRELDRLIDGFLTETGAAYPRPNPAYRPGAVAEEEGETKAAKKKRKAK